MRTFTAYTTTKAKAELEILADTSATVPAYQQAMTALGRQLAVAIGQRIELTDDGSVCVVCTVEDADYLAKGMLDELQSIGVSPTKIKLVCFWNERVRQFANINKNLFDVAPIIKSYREKVDVESAILIVVKSIISGSCVVKTNLATLIDHMTPHRVIVAAPVMLEGAEGRLASEFPKEIADRFEYFKFAIDNERRGVDYVFPGIGGSVYERLGFGDYKSSHVPQIVKERRRMVV